MADGPEQVGEGVVFEQVRVLQQAENEGAPGEEKVAQLCQRCGVGGEVALVGLGKAGRLPVVGLAPCLGDRQVAGEIGLFAAEGVDPAQKAGADLAHEGADHHVELFDQRLLFPLVEQPLDDQGDQQHLHRDEHDADAEVEKEGARVAKQCENGPRPTPGKTPPEPAPS